MNLEEQYSLTEVERQERWDRLAELQAMEEDVKAQVKELEASLTPGRVEATRLRHQVVTAELLDNPVICEPHGLECVFEPPGPMSAGAMMHIEDGKVCYAGSIGRRSDFTDEELDTYRRIKARGS